jgi:MYXO-CTERM domain-containing protein
MSSQRHLPGALALALAASLAAPGAQALIVARVTRHGYILVDEPDAFNAYAAQTPVGSTQGTLQFVADVTTALDAIGAPHADYVATMQTTYEQTSLAFYLGLRNDTYGIGERDPLGRGGEIYDLNSFAATSFPVTGFVFLNTIQLYSGGTMGGGRNLGPDVICTQEFGHRFGAFVHIPPYPGPVDSGDAGTATDAAATGDAAFDATGSDAADDAVNDASGDAAASAPDAAPPPPLAVDALLGRQRAHWSYFMNTTGSPMEGNAWAETSPGVFTTQAYTPRFAPLDLYLMGLIPPEQVPPFWIIAEPNVNGQQDSVGAVINRESPPNSRTNRRPVTITGRRVTYTIDDIIRANGRRIPSSVSSDGGTAAQRDLNVVWVLLTTQDLVTDALATAFDSAIDVCSTGYANAAHSMSHLVPAVAQPADGGTAEGGTDAAAADAQADAAAETGAEQPAAAPGGCSCRASSPSRGLPTALSALGAAGLALARRRRRRTGTTPSTDRRGTV